MTAGMSPFASVMLILTVALCATGLVLWLFHRKDEGEGAAEGDGGNGADATEEGCCGMHVTCEKDSLLSAVSPEIEYYDDEELDAYAGRGADDYDERETEEFRDVLLTLRAEEIAGWARSTQLRGITLPREVREELLLIVSEARAAKEQQEKK